MGELLHEEVDRARGVPLGEHPERFLANGLLGVVGEALPAGLGLRVEGRGGEAGDEGDPVLDAAGGGEVPQDRLESVRDRGVEQEPPRHLLRLALALDGQGGQALLGAGDAEPEQDGRRGPDRGLRLALALRDHDVGRLGVGDALEHRQDRVPVGAVGPEQHPRQVLRLQALGRGELGEELVALLARLVGLLREPLQDDPGVRVEHRHAAGSIAGGFSPGTPAQLFRRRRRSQKTPSPWRSTSQGAPMAAATIPVRPAGLARPLAPKGFSPTR